MTYVVPANPNVPPFAPDLTIPTQGPITDLESISIYECLGAIYSSNDYLVMDSQGTRVITIGTLGSPNQGSLRSAVNSYITTNLGNAQIYALRGYLCIWDKIKLSNITFTGGSIGGAISGMNAVPEDKVAKLLRLIKGLLPVITVAEYKARAAAESPGIDSVGGGRVNSGSNFNVEITM